MGEILNFSDILTGEEAANLFNVDDGNTQLELDTKEKSKENTTEDNNKENEFESTAEVIDSDNLFGDVTETKPESVGSEEDKQGKQEDTTSEEDSTSPDNFYSSLTGTLAEDGVFPDLDDEAINKVLSPEDFIALINERINQGIEEGNKRAYEALNAGVLPDAIKLYEGTLNVLNSFTDELISAETEQGEELRRRLLELDFLNKGYTSDRAKKMTEKLIASGEDIDEAKEALISNKEYFNNQYNTLVAEAKKRWKDVEDLQRKQAENLKKDILSSDKVFGDISLDKNTRQKVYDNIAKPVYKDPTTGLIYTAILKYKVDNENEFLKNVSLLFTLTDGFKDIKSLVAPTAKKEVKSHLKDLESKLRNNSRRSGNLKLAGDRAKSTPTSLFDSGFLIDL